MIYQIKKPNRFKKLLHLPEIQKSGQPDWFLVGLFFVIIIFGLLALSSASSIESFRRFGGTYTIFFRQVLRGFIPGLIAFIILSNIDYKKFEKYSVHFFGLSLFLLILVFLPGIGQTLNGAKSWINFFGIPFQPAEIVKLFLTLSLSGWFAYRNQEANKDFWNGLVPFAFMLGLVSLLIILQPDIGTLMILVLIALAVYFVAGASISHLMILGLGGVLTLILLILSAPYRLSRLLIFFHPEQDPQGTGYHISQALLAVGSGGLFGLGFGQSRQKFAYLPEVMGDSIFAVIAEELGLIFSCAVVIAFLLLAWRCYKLYLATDNEYGRYIIVGITSWFVFQSFCNIAAMVGLMPLTGIPLPFVSYGGTSLAICMSAAGILVNISKHAKPSR